jgi:hypothetical protein
MTRNGRRKMKSNNAVIGIGLLFLIFATAASITFWMDVSSPVKIGMFALGFGSGVAVGTLIARRMKG